MQYCLILHTGKVAGYHTHFSLYHCGSDLIKDNVPSVLLKLKQVTTAMVDLPRGTTPFKEADERCIALSDCASSKCSSLYSAFYYTSPKLK